MICHSGSSGATTGSSVPHPKSSTSARAAAWRGFMLGADFATGCLNFKPRVSYFGLLGLASSPIAGDLRRGSLLAMQLLNMSWMRSGNRGLALSSDKGILPSSRDASIYFVFLARSHSLAVSKLFERNQVESGTPKSTAPLVGSDQPSGGTIKYQPTSASAAAWRGFIYSVYQNAKVRNSDLPADAVPIRAERLNFNF
jgi:hypothetical protein